MSAPAALARAGLAAVLRGDAGISVVGEAAPDELAHLAAALEPDVVVEQREEGGPLPHVPSVVLVEDPRFVWNFEGPDAEGERGARAVLSRDASPEELLAAVHAVAAGLVVVQPQTLAFAATALQAPPRPRFESLSPREIDVLNQLARGAPNKAIARALGISEHTVKFHITSIFSKLHASSRTEAVTQGVRLGLIML